MKYGSAKVQCTCRHEFQDKEHGKYIRVASVCHPKAHRPVRVLQGGREFAIESYTVEGGQAVLRLKEEGFDPSPVVFKSVMKRIKEQTHAL